MNALYEQLKERGFVLLLVNLGEDPEVVRRAANARGYTAPILVDTGRRVADVYAVTATPTVFILDRQLRILGRAVGRRDWAGETGRKLILALAKS